MKRGVHVAEKHAKLCHSSGSRVIRAGGWVGGRGLGERMYMHAHACAVADTLGDEYSRLNGSAGGKV